MTNVSLVRDLEKDALEGTVTFPEVVMRLSKAGVESYHVDYLTGEARYYYGILLEKRERAGPRLRTSFGRKRFKP